ncbi:MAG: UDP-N-acetylmuramate dehydrogenase [Planctomycetota bacterium]|jgi:UDP-N-acetylmuramate dehydrogenase
MARRTSLRVGGAPEYLFEPATEAEAAEVLALCRDRRIPTRYLGGGYNVLVHDAALEGAVVATRRLRHFQVLEDRLKVGAGYSFTTLVRHAVRLGVPVLPGCPGIPGSVGGAVFMNAGGRFGTVGEALLAVTGLDPEGRPFTRRIREGDLGYRWSVFEGCLVTGAVFRRDPGRDPAAQQALFDRALAWKRETQPLGARSAGCMFKNPDGPLGARSAGRLIDEAGLKGLRVGGAAVSRLHANFIINEGGATSADVQALIDLVRERVHAVHGLELELEVRVWP